MASGNLDEQLQTFGSAYPFFIAGRSDPFLPGWLKTNGKSLTPVLWGLLMPPYEINAANF